MTSLNALLLTPESLLAVAWWHAPTIRGQPDGETERDYRLWYQVGPERVVVASAGIPATQDGATPDWSPRMPAGRSSRIARCWRCAEAPSRSSSTPPRER